MMANLLALANPPKYGSRMNVHRADTGHRANIQLVLGHLRRGAGENLSPSLPCRFRSSSFLYFEMEFTQLSM